VKFSPYNLTDPNGGAPTSVITSGNPNQGLPLYGATFTAYPTQAGYFFQFNCNRQAFHPLTPGVITDWTNSQDGSEYWTPTDTELCPRGKLLASGSSANFRRPTDGANNTTAHSSGDIAGSEMRQSLFEDPPSGTTGYSFVGMVSGFYADGFFDRRSHTHAAYGYNGAANTAVSITTKDVAYIGKLFYNRDNKRSLFFPLSGYRDYKGKTTAGTLRIAGSQGNYWSSSSVDTDRGWLMYISYSVTVYSGSRSFGYAVRCVRE
jgi:hypothetical protein